MTRTQFFLVVMIASFAYYIFPGYLLIMLTTISWVCWIRPKSILVNQLGSGMNGLGIGSFAIDWSTISSYLGTPLASPWFASANVAVGFFLVMYVMTPITYWSNIYSAKTFPIFLATCSWRTVLCMRSSTSLIPGFNLITTNMQRRGLCI